MSSLPDHGHHTVTDRRMLVRTRIGHAATWVRSKARSGGLRTWLRTECLAPARHDSGPPPTFEKVVEEVVERRAQQVRWQSPIGETRTPFPGERLLLFDPDASLSDGAAAVETSGFFDDDNTPPWDLWLMHVSDPRQSPHRWIPFDSYLISWIPEECVALAQRAINVIPDDCLMWVEGSARPFAATLNMAELFRPTIA